MPALFSEVRAVFFDLDDTLCGYWDACKAALRESFTEHAPEGHETDALVCRWAEAFRAFAPGLRDLGLYEGYLKSGAHTRAEQMRRTLKLLEIENEELALRLGEHYGERRNANLRLFPDALLVLDRFARRPLPAWTHHERTRRRPTPGDRDARPRTLLRPDLHRRGGRIRQARRPGCCATPRSPWVSHRKRSSSWATPTGTTSSRRYARAGARRGVRRASDVPPSADPTVAGIPEERPEGSPEPDVVIEHLWELLPPFRDERRTVGRVKASPGASEGSRCSSAGFASPPRTPSAGLGGSLRLP